MNEYKSDILDIIKTDNFYSFCKKDYDKIYNYINNNQISNFSINYIKKKKPQYNISNTSFSLDRTNYIIYNTHNLFLDGIKGNNSSNQNIISYTDKKFNSNQKYFLYNKLLNNEHCDNSNGEIYKSAKELNKININNYEEDNNKNLYINDDEKLKYMNTENKAKTSYKHSNNFINTKNKKDTLKINLTSIKKLEDSDKIRCIDSRGFIISEDGSFIDNDGDFFNSDNGEDINNGKYNRYGEYINGPEFNKDLKMYNKDIKSTGLSIDKLKQEINEKEAYEFDKIKYEAMESKKLLKKYLIPYEMSDDSESLDSSDSENINEENKKENSHLSLTKDSNINNKNNIDQDIEMKENDDSEFGNYNNNKNNIDKDIEMKENDDSENGNVNNNNIIDKDIEMKENDDSKNGNNNENNKTNLIKKKRIYQNRITEKVINKENNFIDIENQIYINKILDKYLLCQEDKEEAIQNINDLFIKYQKKK